MVTSLASWPGELATERQQGALAALALSSRLLATIVKPLLYRRPHFASDSSLALWADSSPYRSRARRGRRAEPSDALPEIHEVRRRACVTRRSVLTLLGDMQLSFSDVSPIWKFLSLTPLTYLRELAFVDCDLPGDLLARLLEPPRHTITSLTLHNCGCEPAVQFILQYLHYFDTVELEDVDPPTKKESAAKKSARLQKQRLKAITDWETFDSLLVGQHGTDEHTPSVLAARPPSEHPFSALDELSIDMTMGGGQELYLVFCTNFFPVLKKLHLAGSYPAWTIEKDERFFLRRSVHR